jgi:hypothetical protein
MRKHTRLALVGTATLALGLCSLLAAGRSAAADDKANPWKPSIPEDDLNKLVDQDVKLLQEKLSGKMDKKTARKVRMAAIMIAVYAQNAKNGRDAQRLATLRDAAIKMADAAKEERFDEIKKDAEGLASVKADPAAQPGKVFVPKDFEVEDLMRPFALPSLGGEGFEKRIISLTKRPLPAAQISRESEELALMAYKAAMIGQIAKTHNPEKEPRAAKDQKDWELLSGEMYEGAMEFAAAAKAKDPKALKTAAVKLNNNCSACHKKFRIQDD